MDSLRGNCLTAKSTIKRVRMISVPIGNAIAEGWNPKYLITLPHLTFSHSVTWHTSSNNNKIYCDYLSVFQCSNVCCAPLLQFSSVPTLEHWKICSSVHIFQHSNVPMYSVFQCSNVSFVPMLHYCKLCSSVPY